MVGDELLDGRTLETNSRYLIGRLRRHRAEVGLIQIVADRVDEIVRAMKAAHRASVAVVVSGGLGPTPDDLTRDALASLTGEELILDEGLAGELKRRYRERGREMPESNLRQALRTSSSRPIANPRGTAPGLLHVHEGVPLVLLPGVPAELKTMWEETAEQLVVPLAGGGMPEILRLRTARLPESRAVDLVQIARIDPSLVEVAFCVSDFGVDILVRACREGVRLLDLCRGLIEILGEKLYAIGDLRLDALVSEELARRAETVAVAESCTGGLLGGALSWIPGSSRSFRGGIIAYDNEVKIAQLGVDEQVLRAHGAVSAETAVAMAEGARERLKASWALSVTGVAGPGGGTPEKPVGTVFLGLAGPEASRSDELHLPGDREQNRRWSVAAALDLLRREWKMSPVDARA